jgi:antitoxin component of MazEF toxin-antitoxin module
MVKKLTQIGNSKGILIDKAILDLLHINENAGFDISVKDGGLFLKPINLEDIYQKKAKKHRKTLDKLGK